MTTYLFVIANVKRLRPDGSFRIVLPFLLTSWSVGNLNSAISNSFHNRVEFGTILEGLRNFGGRGVEHPNPPPLPLSVCHCRKLKIRICNDFALNIAKNVPNLLKLKDGGVMDGRMHGEKERNEHLFTHSLTFRKKKKANNLSLSEVMYKFCVSTVTTC